MLPYYAVCKQLSWLRRTERNQRVSECGNLADLLDFPLQLLVRRPVQLLKLFRAVVWSTCG